jgi:heme exporter protein B
MSTIPQQVINEPVGIVRLLFCVCKRELSIAIRKPGQWLNPLLFFVIVVTLFPLGVGPSPNTLSLIAPGVLWVSALLAVLLSLDSLFASDYVDGTLEQLVLSEQSLSIIVLGKVLSHWLLSGVPLLIISPLLAMLINLPTSALPELMLSLFLGTLTMSLLGAIGAALTVGLNQAGVLLSLLVLPLTVPVLIFGSSAVAAAATDLPANGQLFLLAALAVLGLALAPFTAAAALRIGVSGSN